MVYAFDMKKENMNEFQTAKVFFSGESQVVRLPQDYHFDSDEVFIKRIGDAVILFSRESLIRKYDHGVYLLSDDFLSEGIPDNETAEREQL